MEALQAYTYTVVDRCGDTRNQAATVVSYLHIAFQPFFINAISMHFLPQYFRKRIERYVYGLCLLATTLYLLRLYPFEWTVPCYELNMHFGSVAIKQWTFQIPFCGRKICSTLGDWHIAWQIPARFNYYMDNAYMWASFCLPVIYGSWRVTLYLALCGPFLAFLTTNSSNEWVAVWCLYSIALLSAIIKSPLRKYLYVQSWYGIKNPFKLMNS